MYHQKILIIEDDSLFATEVEMLLFRIGFKKTHLVHDSDSALHMIEIMEPDLILMDINIEGTLTGIDIAHKIKDKAIPIIFMTSMTDETIYVEAKKNLLAGYLVKPFDKLTLQSAVELALQPPLTADEKAPGKIVNDSLLIKKSTSFQKLAIQDIVYIQSQGNYCALHTINGRNHLIYHSLVKLTQKLQVHGFVRIHKQFTINLHYIKDIALGANQLKLHGVELPVGRSYRDDLMSKFDILS